MMAEITMASEDELQARADALAADMVRTLNGILRDAALSLGNVIVAAVSDPQEAALGRAEASWMDAVNGQFFPQVADAYVTSAERVHLELIDVYGGPAEDVPFVGNEAAISYLVDTSNRMVGVSEGTWARARAQLIEGFTAGESIEELSARLMTVSDWSESRARTVARTEIISASNAGALAEIRATGANAKKTWLATMDARTREAHRVADGQTVNVNNMFIVDGEFLDYPGDPEGEPGNVINCRCTMTFDVSQSELTTALEDLPDVSDEFDPADFIDLESLTAAAQREEYASKFKEILHPRSKGGRFRKKGSGPGSGAKKSSGKPGVVARGVGKGASGLVKVTAAVLARLVLGPGTSARAGDRTVIEPDNSLGTVRGVEPDPADPNTAAVVHVERDDDPGLTFAIPADNVQVVTDAPEDPNVLTDPNAANPAAPPPFAVPATNVPPGTPARSTAPTAAPAPAPAVAPSPPPANAPVILTPGGRRIASPLTVDPNFPVRDAADAQRMQDDMLAAEGPWTDAEREGVVTYSGSGEPSYEDMNGCLRTGTGCTAEIDALNDGASSAMRTTTEPITVFRGANLAALGSSSPADLAARVGQTVSDPGFTSATVDQAFAYTGNVQMQIEVPAGARGGYIASESAHPVEQEFTLDRDTEYEIVEVVPSTDPDTPSFVRLRVIV